MVLLAVVDWKRREVRAEGEGGVGWLVFRDGDSEIGILYVSLLYIAVVLEGSGQGGCRRRDCSMLVYGCDSRKKHAQLY